ncbi:hypothetical protein ABIA16_004199 [Sinorhizobium fredii]
MPVRIEGDEGRSEIHPRQFLRNQQPHRLPFLIVSADGLFSLHHECDFGPAAFADRLGLHLQREPSTSASISSSENIIGGSKKPGLRT